MAEPASDAPDFWEAAVEQSIAICDGDVCAALRAALVANSFGADGVERLTRLASFGFARGRISPARKASAKLDRWREISAASETDMPRWPQEIADAVLFDIRYGLNFKVGARSRPATDQEIDLVARVIVERLQQANWVIKRGPPAPLGDTPNAPHVVDGAVTRFFADFGMRSSVGLGTASRCHHRAPRRPNGAGGEEQMSEAKLRTCRAG